MDRGLRDATEAQSGRSSEMDPEVQAVKRQPPGDIRQICHIWIKTH